MIAGQDGLPFVEVAPPLSPAASSSELSVALASEDLSKAAVTVIGCGAIGREFVRALKALGVDRLTVCSRSAGPLQALAREVAGLKTVAGGLDRLGPPADVDELAIVATPIAQLAPVAEGLARLGYRRLLVEKPVALETTVLERLAARLTANRVETICAYNRVAYPSFAEVRSRTAAEGGIRSCVYTFTELTTRILGRAVPVDVLARWGIANSLHVIGMAHGLIGLPERWSGVHAGGQQWHPTGDIFVGAGVSDRGIPFAYHADWGSSGRWSIEVHTEASSYRLCPLERVFRRTTPMGEWENLPLTIFAPDVKPGFAEEVAAMLSPRVRAMLPLVTVEEAIRLTRHAEQVFGYAERPAPEAGRCNEPIDGGPTTLRRER